MICILCGFAILFRFLWIFLLILSAFYAFSEPEFTLILTLQAFDRWDCHSKICILCTEMTDT